MTSKSLEIYIDGASSGNPGPAGTGVVIYQNNRIIKNLSLPLGMQTNNFAEYSAMLFGLIEAVVLKAKNVKIYTDSELLHRQINKIYKVKSPGLLGLHERIQELIHVFDSVEIKYIPRRQNLSADRLARQACLR
ncbi:MAG: ribonuclease HI family protein [Candidatus Omnitrophica bacterium]|nr:ribonuclease HI family protein [Candidatus Omnitrophota bacterium]